MTNNVKRFLAASLLSLMPSVALAEHYDVSGLLANRQEYVSLRPTETIQLPSGRLEADRSSLAGTTFDTFFVANWTGVNTFPGYTLTGSPNALPPNPLAPSTPPAISGAFQMVVPTGSLTQTYYYTTNAAAPTGAAKTCLWQLNITLTGTVCTGTLSQTAYGTLGVICSIDTAQTFVDPTTCQAQVVTIIQ